MDVLESLALLSVPEPLDDELWTRNVCFYNLFGAGLTVCPSRPLEHNRHPQRLSREMGGVHRACGPIIMLALLSDVGLNQ